MKGGREEALGDGGDGVAAVLEEVGSPGIPEAAGAVDESCQFGVGEVGAVSGNGREGGAVAFEEQLVGDGPEVELDEEEAEGEEEGLCKELEGPDLVLDGDAVEALAGLVGGEDRDELAASRRANPPRKAADGLVGRRRVVLGGLDFELGVGLPGLDAGGVCGEAEGDVSQVPHDELVGGPRAEGLEDELEHGKDEGAPGEDDGEGGGDGVLRRGEEVEEVEVRDVDGGARRGEEAPAEEEEVVPVAHGREDVEAKGGDDEAADARDLWAELVEDQAPEEAGADGEGEADGVDVGEAAAHRGALEAADAELAVDAPLMGEELHRGPSKGDAAEDEGSEEAGDELEHVGLDVVEAPRDVEAVPLEEAEAAVPRGGEEEDDAESAHPGAEAGSGLGGFSVDAEVCRRVARVRREVEREEGVDRAVGAVAVEVDRPRAAGAAAIAGVDVVDDDERGGAVGEGLAEGHAVPLEGVVGVDVVEVDVVEVEDEALRDDGVAAVAGVESTAAGDVGRRPDGGGLELEDARPRPLLADEGDLEDEQVVEVEGGDPDDGGPVGGPGVGRPGVDGLDPIVERLHELDAVDACGRVDDVVQEYPRPRAVVVRRGRAVLEESGLLGGDEAIAGGRQRAGVRARERPRAAAPPPVPSVDALVVLELAPREEEGGAPVRRDALASAGHLVRDEAILGQSRFVKIGKVRRLGRAGVGRLDRPRPVAPQVVGL
mmetsp:Transcript_20062/g.63068  ORF Transcript_20062/g.63068 Transcript_20062/m.63068 type:complete len:717 (+) Transcript_20062:880-3030(+)